MPYQKQSSTALSCPLLVQPNASLLAVNTVPFCMGFMGNTSLKHSKMESGTTKNYC